VSTQLEALIDTLLYEGYALYPYTPGATKNATPTPFGIVYPPSYAARSGSTFDHLEMECELVAPARAVVTAEVRFLQARGVGHQAEPRRVLLEPVTLSELVRAVREERFGWDGVAGRALLSAAPLEGAWRVRLRVENQTPLQDLGAQLGRAQALAHALISTHPVLRTSSGRFVSPLEARGCQSTNTWPVLTGDGDECLVGAAIVLPDHPAISPRSRFDLFDNTEIEEALLLHIKALSDDERAAIAGQDPAVRDMVERARTVGADELRDLHGEFLPSTASPGAGPAGESEITVGGSSFRCGDVVVLRPRDGPGPGDRRDVLDALVAGKRATIERIYLDPDDRVYLGVTLDDDPGRDLMRETGRYLFFFSDEVELRAGTSPEGAGEGGDGPSE
jgi:hypothetical protein